MQYNKQKILLACALVLTCGIISCSSDKNLSGSVSPTGMLVHDPVFIHRDGSHTVFTDLRKNDVLNLNIDDKLKMSPVEDGGRGLTTLQITSECAVGNQSIGADSVTLPYASEYSIAQFFSAKTLFNSIAPDATALMCAVKFTVNAVNGSTHSFSLRRVNLITENSARSSVEIIKDGHPVSGLISMDYNQLNHYRVELGNINYHDAVFLCETKRATVGKSEVDRPLDILQFANRSSLRAKSTAQRNKAQQYCRLIVYQNGKTVIAASNLILMTFIDPGLRLARAPSPMPYVTASTLPSCPDFGVIFGYSRRDFSLQNTGFVKPVYVAVPFNIENTIQYEGYNYKFNNYYWSNGLAPTRVTTTAPSHINGSYLVFEIDPGYTADIAFQVWPSHFDCDQMSFPVMYDYSISPDEIQYFIVKNPNAPIANDNIEFQGVIEKQRATTISKLTFMCPNPNPPPGGLPACHPMNSKPPIPFSQAIFGPHIAHIN